MNRSLFSRALPGAVLLLLVSMQAPAYIGLCCAKCGGNMPMNIPGGGIPETHEFRLKISPMYMHMDGLRDGTHQVDVDDILGMPVDMGGNPTGKYMAAPRDMDMKMLNASLGYSFTDRFFAGLMFMYRDNDMDMKFSPMMQALTGEEGFTMKSEGVGDTMLMAKYRLFADDPLIPTSQVSLLLGLSLPTGSIDEKNKNHPLDSRQNELLPYGMQLGTGTFDPSLGLLYQGSSTPWWWGVDTTYTARFYDNKRDYHLGDELRIDGYAMYQFAPDWLAQIQLNGHWQGDISGEMDEFADGRSGHVLPGNSNSPAATPLWDTENYGGRQVFATAGLQWQPAPLHIIDLTVGLPLYQDLNGPQLETDYRVMLTWYIEMPTKRSVRYGLYRSQPAGPGRLGF